MSVLFNLFGFMAMVDAVHRLAVRFLGLKKINGHLFVVTCCEGIDFNRRNIFRNLVWPEIKNSHIFIQTRWSLT